MLKAAAAPQTVLCMLVCCKFFRTQSNRVQVLFVNVQDLAAEAATASTAAAARGRDADELRGELRELRASAEVAAASAAARQQEHASALSNLQVCHRFSVAPGQGAPETLLAGLSSAWQNAETTKSVFAANDTAASYGVHRSFYIHGICSTAPHERPLVELGLRMAIQLVRLANARPG